jgi:hypothetical protein
MKTKTIFLSLLGCALLLGGAMAFAIHSTETLVIESEESKNKEMGSVFNQIQWFSTATQDVWMMNQSHFGRHLRAEQWERLAIVIDKTKSPKVARFYQFKPGPLEWNEDLKLQRVSYRASCFLCHNNGPRAIRPVEDSSLAPMSWKQKLKLIAWNLRIKTYGRIKYSQEHDKEDPALKVLFAYHGGKEEDPLKVPVCQKCHNEDGFLARGFLHRQQAGTIEHMVARHHMPPPGFTVSEKESHQLQDFIRGF